MMLTFSDCDRANQEAVDEQSGVEENWCIKEKWPAVDQGALGGLTTVRITQEHGLFLLTAPLSPEEQGHLQVDMTSDALLIRNGRVSRWVPVPQDALLDEAVVQLSEGLLMVSIPVQDRGKVRHVVHVW
jgi:hypothetical protein